MQNPRTTASKAKSSNPIAEIDLSQADSDISLSDDPINLSQVSAYFGETVKVTQTIFSQRHHLLHLQIWPEI